MGALRSLLGSGRAINLALIMAASGVRGVGQWLFVFILIRVSGPESVGVYGLATAMVIPVVALTSLQLPRVISTERVGERELGRYVAVRLIGTVVNALVLLPLVLVVSPDALWPVVALVFQTSALALVEVYQSALLQQGRMRMYGVVNLLTQTMSWIGLAIVLQLTKDMAVSLAVSGGLILVTYAAVVLILREENIPHDAPLFRDLTPIVRENLPLGLALLVDSLTTHSPRFLLEHFHGAFDLGILVGLLTFLSASTLINESLGQAATPYISGLVHAGKRGPFQKFVRLLTVANVGLVVVVPVVIWFIGPPVVGILLDDVYAEYPFALAGVAFIAMLQLGNRATTTALNAAKRLGPLFGVNLITLCIAVLFGFLLIPSYSVNGAVLALAITALSRWAAIQIMISRLERSMTQ